ncbi:MAG: hypothetical protein H6626_03805 [Pseudobdellovibrionaceae bacterium]|nr:hypothetical protein [Bdellovibrionales bacterium]USN48223.1 MAG: hypothetical protein H6626_03805 [Pseudobdellovibrionaceae bacterium]
MKLALRLMMAWFAFTVEVKVASADLDAHKLSGGGPVDLIEEPRHCWKSASVCAIRNNSKSVQTLNWEAASVRLAPGAAMVRLSGSHMQMVEGDALVMPNESFSIRSEFGECQLLSGKALLEKSKHSMKVSLLFGSAEVHLLGGEKPLLLEPGFEQEMGLVTLNGVAQTQLARPVAIKPLLKKWAQLFDADSGDFKSEVLAFRPIWEEAVEAASVWHRQLVNRHLAEVAGKEARRQAAKRHWQQETQKILRQYRKKLYLDQ